MLRAMIFIDYENFNINKDKYYKGLDLLPLRIDFTVLPNQIISIIPKELQLIKTFIFAPKPDKFLMNIPYHSNKYKWLHNINNTDFLSVIEGSHIARPTGSFEEMNPFDRKTYYIVEKGTDVNLATHLVTKGFMNAYDVAIIVSGDTDYIPVINILNTIGKSVIVVGTEGQNLSKFTYCTDFQLHLDDTFYRKCAIVSSSDSDIIPEDDCTEKYLTD